MDRHLKERLVGAAVLVAAAIILIPEMLSGPRDSAPAVAEQSVQTTDPSGVKTYTIDLAAPKAPVAEQPPTPSPAFVETAPPPPEASEQAPAQTKQPESAKASTPQPANAQASRERDPQRLEGFTAPDALPDKPAAKPEEKTIAVVQAVKPEIDNAKQNAGGWAVQVASFGVRATSDRVAADLKAKGYAAFVTSFAVKGQTMYRVRVGPVADRAAVEALLKKIKPLHPNAAIVAP